MNLFDPGYYTEHDLRDAGFRAIGRNVRIAKNNTIIGLANISIGDNVRIDGYCALVAAGSGWLTMGSHIHIGGWCYLSAGDGIKLGDFCGLSQGTRVYSRTDNYNGECLTGPTVPASYTNVIAGPVKIGRHAIIGSGTVVMPRVTIGNGVAVGALSFVNQDLDAWSIYGGNPIRRIKDRSTKLCYLEDQLKNEANKLPA